MKPTKAIIVAKGSKLEIPIENLVEVAAFHGYTVIGYKGTEFVDEIAGQPKFKGLLGPMHGGNGVVRYEDQNAYNLLSL